MGEPKFYALMRAAWLVGAIITIFLLFMQPAEAKIIRHVCDTGVIFTPDTEANTVTVCRGNQCATLQMYERKVGPVGSYLDILYWVPIADSPNLAVVFARAYPTGYVEVEIATVDKLGEDFSYIEKPTSHNCYPHGGKSS